MAMFETIGFCPANSFLHYAIRNVNEEPDLIEKRLKILGDRKEYMVYDPEHTAYGTE